MRRGKQQSVKKCVNAELKRDNPTSVSIPWLVVILIIAVVVGLLNRYHVANMFESDRHFSYLSDLEREMTFRTEMGLYYSYYKTIINAETLTSGLSQVINDNMTEFGHTINTLKRFNLYPELILACMYRVYSKTAAAMNIETQSCWKTDRGSDLPPILSCEGMGNPAYFYVNGVFALWGLMAGGLFLYGCLISDSVFGGIIAASAFFFNHGEATRVQWTPPLRESFGYPFCLILMLVVTYMLKFNKSGLIWIAVVAALTTLFMISWQFASFALSTTVGCIFVVYVLGYAGISCLRSIASGFLVALIASFVLLFGNEMLLTSLFLSSLITLQLILSCQRVWNAFKYRLVIIIVQILAFVTGTLLVKFSFGFIFRVEDDAHVFDILKSKFTNYSDFHTRLYTCAAEFNFMLPETPWKLACTLLIPVAVVALIFACLLCLRIERETSTFVRDKHPAVIKPFGEVLYNALQLLMFSIMAVLIMRLKLFFTPHLCIFAAVVASDKIVRPIFGRFYCANWHKALCVLLIAGMAVQGVANLRQQFSIMGEYSNVNQERLFEWITSQTPKDAVFAGAMPTMANLKLSTGRAIVNHPHYEDAGLRERTVKVYSVFSRKSHQEVYNILKSLGVQYYVFEYGWCRKGGKPGCSMPELYDIHDVENRHKEPLCDKIQRGELGPFKTAYENQYYRVLRL